MLLFFFHLVLRKAGMNLRVDTLIKMTEGIFFSKSLDASHLTTIFSSLLPMIIEQSALIILANVMMSMLMIRNWKALLLDL